MGSEGRGGEGGGDGGREGGEMTKYKKVQLSSKETCPLSLQAYETAP